MDKNIAERWIAALESGDYAQGVGYLRTAALVEERGGPDRFCCLGVLCELAVEDGVIPAPTLSAYGFVYEYEGERGTLIDEVMEWSGMKSKNGCLPPVDVYGENDTLAGVNDRSGSFVPTIELIREYMDVL